MKKIVLVANTDWYLYNFRLSLARYLRERGYEILLISPPGRFAALLQEAGFRWIPWKVGRKSLTPWGELNSLFQICRIYRAEKPDLVHHHTIKPVLYGSVAARLTRTPAIINSITGRGYVFLGEDHRARVISRLIKPFYRYALGYKSCGVIFENEADKGFFLEERLVDPVKTRLVEGVGVDTEIFTPLPEPEEPVVILMAARMLWDKGVGVLVEAARRLKDTPARIVLVGEPDPGNPKAVDRDTLTQWHEDGLVEWWGWRDDMREVYRSCHIVALPSFYEGVPTALLEAAACARPIVASDIPGCRAVVRDGENGFLVPVNDPVKLADALRCLVLDKELRDQMGAAGRKIVLQKYTTAKVNEETLGVYCDVWGSHEARISTEHGAKL